MIDVSVINAAIRLILLKDGDRDHGNHSDLTCEQSMAIVSILRDYKKVLSTDEAPYGPFDTENDY